MNKIVVITGAGAGVGRATATEFARNGWLNLVGGCCGTKPDWIFAIGEAVKDIPPRKIPDLPYWSSYSGTEALIVRPETNFIMVGERTNITGSKRFSRLIKEGNFDAALVVAREQVENGANIIDVVDRVKKLLPQLRASLPSAVDVAILTDRTITIRASGSTR